MKKPVKLTSLLLAIALLASVFAGCGDGKKAVSYTHLTLPTNSLV